MKRIHSAIGLLLAAGAAIAAVAGPAISEPGRRLERLSQELDLTPDQEAQIRTIFEGARADTAGGREELKAAREELKALLAGNASEAELRQQHDAIQSLREELGDRRFEGILDVREVLTPEQRTRLTELHAGRRQRRGDFGPGS